MDVLPKVPLFNDCDHHVVCSSDENAFVRSDGNVGVY